MAAGREIYVRNKEIGSGRLVIYSQKIKNGKDSERMKNGQSLRKSDVFETVDRCLKLRDSSQNNPFLDSLNKWKCFSSYFKG